MEEARKMFRDKERTEFIIVTIPTVMAMAESERLATSLQAEDVPCKRIVVNQMVRSLLLLRSRVELSRCACKHFHLHRYLMHWLNHLQGHFCDAGLHLLMFTFLVVLTLPAGSAESLRAICSALVFDGRGFYIARPNCSDSCISAPVSVRAM
jgi:hypothetical protein